MPALSALLWRKPRAGFLLDLVAVMLKKSGEKIG